MPLYPKLPGRVKPSELTMINPVWIDIQTNPQEFVPHQNVTYLWVMRDDGSVILGVEEPWKYPEAFDPSLKPMLEKMEQHYKEQAKFNERDGSGGHPTLSAWFNETTGEASGHAGFAYIGGELSYDPQRGRWILTNQSGRFGRRDELRKGEVSQQDVEEALLGAARRIREQTGLDVVVELKR